MPIPDDILREVARVLEDLLTAAREVGYQKGVERGRLIAVQELEAEVASMFDTGKLVEQAELAGALAKAAGWLRRNK